MKLFVYLLIFAALINTAYAQKAKVKEKEKADVESIDVVETPKKAESSEQVFTKVEKEAMFPGGAAAWRKYLDRNLDVNVAKNDKAPDGVYKVRVQFVVDKEGNLSDVKALQVPKECSSCGPAAINVIKKGPKWEPAITNGRHVVSRKSEEVTFIVIND